MNLDQYRKISDREELDQLPYGAIVFEQPDRDGEVNAWRRDNYETGWETHDFEPCWREFGGENPWLTEEITLPVYLIWNPEEHHA